MTNLPQKEQIRNAINEYCIAKGIIKNELSTQAGVSSATFSCVLKSISHNNNSIISSYPSYHLASFLAIFLDNAFHNADVQNGE